VQSVDDTRDNWGTSLWDEKHRLTATFDVEMPFGRNRAWLRDAHPVVEGIVGGWIVAGNAVWRSGRPINWPQDTRQNAYIRALEITGVSWADPASQDLRNPAVSVGAISSPAFESSVWAGILDISAVTTRSIATVSSRGIQEI
jgi:hypothetical protein